MKRRHIRDLAWAEMRGRDQLVLVDNDREAEVVVHLAADYMLEHVAEKCIEELARRRDQLNRALNSLRSIGA